VGDDDLRVLRRQFSAFWPRSLPRCWRCRVSGWAADLSQLPPRPVRIVVGLPARRRCGHHSAPDRSIALGRLGQPFHHRQRVPGAGSNHRPPRRSACPGDGYTLSVVCGLTRSMRRLYDTHFNFIRDSRRARTMYYVPTSWRCIRRSRPRQNILEFNRLFQVTLGIT